MTRIISDAQKRSVFNAIPSHVSISGTVFNASKIWVNQEIMNYPTITLNISSLGAASDFCDVQDGVLYRVSLLTIHVLTKTIPGGPHADNLAGALSNTIIEEIEKWVDPLQGDVRIFDPSEDIAATLNMGTLKETSVSDYVTSVKLYHS